MSDQTKVGTGAMGKTYWRSVEQLENAPETRKYLEREFPRYAADMPPGVSRRTMLKLVGASISMAGLAACRPVEKIVPYVDPPEQVVPGIPRYYATTMPLGLSAYGLVVENHEGRPTKIEGNELHPSTAGASSAWMQAAILNLYDPDRTTRVQHYARQHASLDASDSEGGGSDVTAAHGEAAEAAQTWDDFTAFWKGLEPELLEAGGEGLALLSESFCSPTLWRLREAFQQRFPKARIAAYEPVSEENVFAGLKLATGRDGLQPVYRFENAEVVLSLDSDFLLTHPENVANARGFSEQRRVESEHDGMNRLWVAESGFSLTGANADHRLRMQSRHIGALCAALGAALNALGAPTGAPNGAKAEDVPGLDPLWLKTLAVDLNNHKGHALVIAGAQQPPEVHAAVFALNAALGAPGATVEFVQRRDAARSSLSGLQALAQDLREDKVKTLVILGGNPVYNAPADLDFAEALGHAEHVIRLGAYNDETSAAANWSLPESHFLESWGDARSVDGTASVIQPLILPLYGGKSAVETLGLLAGGEDMPGYDLVRETWAEMLGETDFEERWNKTLHDGVLDGSAHSTVSPAPTGQLFANLVAAEGEGAGELEIHFPPSNAVYDGRWSNHSWLHELPDPMTKLTWDNAALMSPATASAHGLKNGDVARVTYLEREVEAPVWTVPGMADGVIAAPLGYGRKHGGRVAEGIGFDAYALRTSGAPSFGAGASLSKTGKTYKLASTQDHWSMQGRALVIEETAAHYKDNPKFVEHVGHHPPVMDLWKDLMDPDKNPEWVSDQYQWGMTIDLNLCTGCNACVVACQSENNIPVVGKREVLNGREMHWIRLDRYFSGEGANPDADPEAVFQPVACQHCEMAPCEEVCPVAATTHTREGLNGMTYNRCIGTRYCANNCPYKVRRFNYYNLTKDTPKVSQLAYNPDVTVRSRGVMEKCTFCIQRINQAKITAKRESGGRIVDGELKAACQQACPAQAIQFGNLLDPDSKVTAMKANDRNYKLLEELNVRPRTSYLAKLRNPHPDMAPAHSEEGDGGHDGGDGGGQGDESSEGHSA